MRKRFMQAHCLVLDCKDFTVSDRPDDFYTTAISIFTDTELEAYERKIWEAARSGTSLYLRCHKCGWNNFKQDCPSCYGTIDLDEEYYPTYDDYKKSLKDEEKRDGKDA